MRRSFLLSFALSAILADPAPALDKIRVLDTAGDDGWASGSTCSIVYYNRCTLWSWAWNAFEDDGRFGVCADACCGPEEVGSLSATRLRIFTSAPIGWGWTGSISIMNVDANCCPTTVLASQPYLPRGPFDVVSWSQAVPSHFAVVVTTPSAYSPATFGTDHPAAGPTGPQACGFCYPLDRVNHSYVWGTAASPTCPGSTFYDGVCDAQLRWDISLSCEVSVDAGSWGSVKNLYR